jgi:multiple sugar transport system permease protein
MQTNVDRPAAEALDLKQGTVSKAAAAVPARQTWSRGVSEPAATARRRRARWALRQVILLALVTPLALLFLAPWAWMLSTAGKPTSLIWKMPPVWIPPKYLFSNFPEAWRMGDFGRYYLNTAFICAMGVIGITSSSVLAAYAFSRIKFPYRDVLFVIVLSTMMLPTQVTLIPLYIIFSKLHWVNSFRPLVVPLFFGDAFSIFLLRQFFMTIPREYDDAALIDGCSRFGVLFRILIPMIRPAVVVVAIFTFTWAWNDYMGPLIYLNSPRLFTVTLGLTRFVGRTSMNIQYLMAMTAVSTLVPITIFFLTQRFFIQGIVISGIKG